MNLYDEFSRRIYISKNGDQDVEGFTEYPLDQAGEITFHQCG